MPRTFVKARANANPLFEAIAATIAERGAVTMVGIEGPHDVTAIGGDPTAQTPVAPAG